MTDLAVPQATAKSRLEGRWKGDLQGPEADDLDGGWAVLPGSFQHLDGKGPKLRDDIKGWVGTRRKPTMIWRACREGD